MKNLVFTILILTVVGACGASIFDYFTTIYNQAREHVVDLADDDYAFAHTGAVFGGLVEEDEVLSMNYGLESGVSYNVFLFGDEDANDLDIKIYAEDGDMIESDTAVSSSAQITFTVPEDGNYRVEAINYSSDASVFMLGGIMAQGDSHSNSAELFNQAFNRMIAKGQELDEEEDIYFFSNSICFGGGVVPEGENGCVYDLEFPTDSDIWAAAVAADNCEDVDVKVTRQDRRANVDTDWYSDDAELICSEASTEAGAVVAGEVEDVENYAVIYRNYSSDGDTFVVYFIVRD